MIESQRSLNSLIWSSFSCLSSSNCLTHCLLVLVDYNEVLEQYLLLSQVVDFLVDSFSRVDVAVGTDGGFLFLEFVAYKLTF